MYRGGYGRGRGGGYAQQKAFELWPDNIVLPEVNSVKVEKNLVILNQRLCNFWKTSPYHLEETVKQESKNNIDIERYCDWGKSKTTSKRDSIFEFLQLTPKNFPKELVGDSRSKHRKRKRARWNQGAEGKGEKKEGDEDEEDDDEEKKSEEEESSDEGDYDKNIDFDDDEDDFNMEDDGNDDDNAIY